MTVKSRTIDNLGADASVRYAQDKELLDARFLGEEARKLPQKLEISVTTPYIPSEFEKLFSSERINLWAVFAAPPNYGLQTRTLFSYQLIPSLGTYEKQEADLEKLNALQKVLSKKRHQQEKDSQEEHQGEEEEEKERQTLLALFKCIEALDKTLLFINSRRNQYQRG